MARMYTLFPKRHEHTHHGIHSRNVFGDVRVQRAIGARKHYAKLPHTHYNIKRYFDTVALTKSMGK